MSEKPLSTTVETNEHEVTAETLVGVKQHLGAEAVELTIQIDMAETSNDTTHEEKTSSETASMVDAYKAEHGSVQGLSMKDLVEQGFDPDMILLKIGNERLEEKLEIVKIRYGRPERNSEQWQKMEKIEARTIFVTDEEIDTLLEAGANPQHIVDTLQRTQPEDGVDNPSSARIVARIDKLVEAGLPPSILAARLNPSWREAVKDKLADSEKKWQEANRLKAIA